MSLGDRAPSPAGIDEEAEDASLTPRTKESLVGAVRPLRQSYRAVEPSRSSLGDAREEAESSTGGAEGEDKAVAEAAKRRAAHDD